MYVNDCEPLSSLSSLTELSSTLSSSNDITSSGSFCLCSLSLPLLSDSVHVFCVRTPLGLKGD